MAMRLRHCSLLLVLLILLLPIYIPAFSNAASEVPFGINNPFPVPIPPSHADWRVRLSDLELLGTNFVSQTVFRINIEYEEGGGTYYNWRRLDRGLLLYGSYLNATLWLCIDPRTSIYSDGSVEVSPGVYLPHKGKSMIEYIKFLRRLVLHCRTVGWTVAYWGVYNEPHHDYLRAFTNDVALASKAYCRLVRRTYTAIKDLDRDAMVVLGGMGSNTGPTGYGFYRRVLDCLNQSDPYRMNNGYFDYADYHNYNCHTDYKTNMRGHDLSWFREVILAPFNFRLKEILIKEGATHTGKDVDAPAASNYQSESDQAGYLIRRFIYNYAHGASKIQWSILLERYNPNSIMRSVFSYIGLAYNGLPTGDEDWFDLAKHVADPKIHIYVDALNPEVYHFVTWLFEENTGWKTTEVRDTSLPELSDFLFPAQLQELKESGEIWISSGIKKLSFYAYKFLLDKLRDCDWQSVEILQEDADGIYLYKFLKGMRPIYIAWWDWFDEPGLTEKVVTLTLPDIIINSVLVTKAIPGAESGAEATVFLEPYPTYFATSTVPSPNRTVTLTFDQSPIYIEKTIE